MQIRKVKAMIRDDQERIDRLYAKVFGPPAAVPEQPGTEPRFAASAAGPEDPEAEALELALRIQAARCSKNAEKFVDLFDRGNVSGYPSPSEADLALMDQIPFWVYTMGGDIRERMLAMFMLSALATRDKWTEDKYKQYRDLTLDKALQGWKESGRKYYDPENFGRLQWPETEITSKKGKPTPRRKSRLNVDYLLAWLGVTVRFNRVSKLPEFSGLDKLLCGNNKLTFEASIAALADAADSCGLKTGKDDFINLIGLIAELNAYSPVCDYLQRCQSEWDGQRIYIDRLFSCLHLSKTPAQDPAFCKKLLTVWLITAARAAFNEGEFTAQGLLILAGEQGIGKTRFKNMLLPDPSWSCDRTIDPAIKDDVLDAAHYWLVELAEFRETMRYQSIDRLKQYITQSKDAVRPPYARATREYPRTTVFIGTVNGLSFLQDHTGNRRYWPIAVDAIDIDDKFPRDQLWGEVMHRAFEKKEPAYLTREEISTLAAQNENYERVSEMEQLLLDELAWDTPVEAWRLVTMTDLCYELPGVRANQSASLGRTVTAMKRKDGRIGLPSGHHGGRMYLLPPPRKADGGPEICPDDGESAKLLW